MDKNFETFGGSYFYFLYPLFCCEHRQPQQPKAEDYCLSVKVPQ